MAITRNISLLIKKDISGEVTRAFENKSLLYNLYQNKISARAVIGQSAMVYCAGKPMEISRV